MMMENKNKALIDSIFSGLENDYIEISNKYPSEWTEENRVMTSDVSPIEGNFNYDNSPYVRELVDNLDSRNSGRVFAIMKGAQIGMSTGLMESGIGWIIANDPANILFLVGHSDLVKDSVSKIDRMISSTGIRPLIRSNSQRARRTKSGDTDNLKEFPGGQLRLGVANHKSLRNFSVKYGFIDDYESMVGDTEQSGSTEKLIDQRFAAFGKQKKLFYISTPELEDNSNILKIYEKGDKREYRIPCQCCGELIPLKWSVDSEVDETRCGIIWDLDENNSLLSGTTRYRCQKCNGEFTDKNKKKFLIDGDWFPTCKPKIEGYRSYQISSLYAPVYMDDWEKYVNDYLDACPVGGERDEAKYKTFVNLVLGIPYKSKSVGLDSKKLMQNQRNYEIGTVPCSISEEDGNGRIVMLTMGVDIGGLENDCRLDYEVVAWSESGSSYSIDHGSIGTYTKKERHYVNRLRQPIDPTKKDNVWEDIESIFLRKYKSDNSNNEFPITGIAIDTGYKNRFVYDYFDGWEKKNISLPKIFLIKGQATRQKIKVGADVSLYSNSKEMPNKLYILKSNILKNYLADRMNKEWGENDEKQPAGFMNFPNSEDGKYTYNNFFSHFEAEEMKIDKNLNFVWKKKAGFQNHLFDCRLYSIASREIFVNEIIFRPNKISRGTWADFVSLF